MCDSVKVAYFSPHLINENILTKFLFLSH